MGMYDYGWRQYMPDIGRWNGMDQLSEAYSSTSPYAYVMNNPIMMFDPDGRLSESFVRNIYSSSSGTIWSNNNDGTFGNQYGDMMRNDGMAMNFDLSTNTFSGRFVSIEIPGVHLSAKTTEGRVIQLRNHINSYLNDWSGDNSSIGIGQPGTWESNIPIWGSGRAAIDHFQNGNYWRGAGYTALALSDVFLIKSLAVGAGKLAMAGIGKLAVGEVITVAGKSGSHVVYHGLDAAGKVRYVGITSREAAVRFGEHLNSFGTGKELLQYEVLKGAEGLSKTQARIWEQTLINQYRLQKDGGLLLNKINSIAQKNWWQYGIK